MKYRSGLHGWPDREQINWSNTVRSPYTHPSGGKTTRAPASCLTDQSDGLDNLQIKSARDSAWQAGFQYRHHGSLQRMIKAAGGTYWSPFWRELDAEKVKEARALGRQVLVWPVNNRDAMNRLLDMGVNGLITDRPELGAEVQRERGMTWQRRGRGKAPPSMGQLI